MHIARGAGPSCYALFYGYGEICVHCECCSKDPVVRAKARLKYFQWLREHDRKLRERYDKEPEDRSDRQALKLWYLKKRNRKLNEEYTGRRITYYRKRLRELGEGEDG